MTSLYCRFIAVHDDFAEGKCKRQGRSKKTRPEMERREVSRTQYFTELESVRQNVIQMGETTRTLFDEALRAVVQPKFDLSAKASELGAQTNHQRWLIHDQCLRVITLQAPVARDARLVTSVLDAIVDFDLIAGYAYEIVALTSATTSTRQEPFGRRSSRRVRWFRIGA
jgi:phosphate uptake regulator